MIFSRSQTLHNNNLFIQETTESALQIDVAIDNDNNYFDDHNNVHIDTIDDDVHVDSNEKTVSVSNLQ